MNNAIIESFVIPDEMPKFNRFDPRIYEERQKYIKEGMFGFVGWKWVIPFVEWINNRRCLEVMAGRGILAYALRQKGVNIIATDDFSWANDHYPKWKETVTEVEKIDAVKAVEKYGTNIDILIMSWPYMDDTAYRVIRKLHEVNSKALIVYIGEGEWGCTADKLFFEHFEEIQDEKFKKVSENYERWEGLHDRMWLGRYKE